MLILKIHALAQGFSGIQWENIERLAGDAGWQRFDPNDSNARSLELQRSCSSFTHLA